MPSSQTPILELNNATVRRQQTDILDRITVTLPAGENTAIIGPNGSGKSTLIRVLMHDIYPLKNDDGTPPVKMFGKERWNIEQLRSKLSIVSSHLQTSFLSNTRRGRISGREAVLSGFFSSLRLFPHFTLTQEMEEKASEALEKMDVAHLAGKMLSVMSTGELRRILIARALVTSPEVLILDEPTTALDLVARHTFMQQIGAIVRGGTTLILITHQLEEVIPEISRTILLKEGRIAYDGSTESALTSEKLSELFGCRISVTRKNGFYEAGIAQGR